MLRRRGREQLEFFVCGSRLSRRTPHQLAEDAVLFAAFRDACRVESVISLELAPARQPRRVEAAVLDG